MRTLRILKVAGLVILGLMFTSCASTDYRSPTVPEHQKVNQDAPHFKTFNSNWIRHGA